jgi:hypothetical protein
MPVVYDYKQNQLHEKFVKNGIVNATSGEYNGMSNSITLSDYFDGLDLALQPVQVDVPAGAFGDLPSGLTDAQVGQLNSCLRLLRELYLRLEDSENHTLTIVKTFNMTKVS